MHIARTLAALLIAIAAPLVQAQSTWTGAVNSNWSNAGNWSGGVPNGSTAVAIIGPGGSATITVDIPVTLQELQLAASKEFFTNTITFSAAGGQISAAAGMQPKFNNNLVFQGSAAITLGDSASKLTAANLTGPGGFTQSGPGTVVVNNTLGLAGPVVVNAGTLDIGASSGTSDLTIVTGATVKTLTSAWGALSGGGTIQTPNSPLTFNQSVDTTFTGTIDTNSSSTVTKAGGGKLTLTGATLTGYLIVSGGTLWIGDGVSGSMTNGIPVTANGTFVYNLPGSRTITNLDGSGAVVVKSGSVSGSNWNCTCNVTVEAPGSLNASVGTTGGMTVDGTWNASATSSLGSLSGSGTIASTLLLVGGNNASTSFSGPITVTGAFNNIVKQGTGTLTLSNLITTQTAVSLNAGTLRSQGATFTRGVSASSGTTFSGYGTFPSTAPGEGLSISTGATLAPSGGVISVAGQLILQQAPYVITIDGPTLGTGYGRVAANTLSFSPFSALTLAGSYTPVIGDSFLIVDNTGAGNPVPFPGSTGTIYTLNGVPLKIAYNGGSGNDWVLAVATQTVTSSAPSGNGLISPSGPQTVFTNATVPFTFTPAVHYHVSSVTGTCPAGSLVGNSYTTGPITGNCTVVANFALDNYTITIDPTTNGTIALIGTQPVNWNETRQFTVTPATGYHINTVTGCGGSLVGNSFTTAAITANCTVTATFAINQYTITIDPTTNGTIALVGTQPVNHGDTRQFTLTPATGYHASTVTGCGGSLAGNTYTTGAITGNCTVTASFAINKYNVTSSGGANGTIVANGPALIDHGTTTTFTVTPDPGYVASASGCNGSLSGNTYTTGPITADCNVSASFVALTVYDVVLEGWQLAPYVVTAASGTATATFNPLTSELTVDLEYSGLSSAEIMSNIRGASVRGGNANILFDLSPPDTSPRTVVVTLTAPQVTMLQAGELYISVQTVSFPLGEIRGQIDNVGATATSGLTVSNAGTGIGAITGLTEAGQVISCAGVCSETIPVGKTVTLTATPGPNSTFAGWSGACSGTAPCVLAKGAAAESVTATFAAITHTLTTTLVGAGTGSVISIVNGIACPGDCSEVLNTPTVVTLNANADAGSVFLGWGGGACSGIGPCSFLMGADTTVTANFAVINAITSANAATFTVTQAGSFTVAATGNPAPSVSATGALPNGVTFNPSTKALAGTPGIGTVGAYPITFTAGNATAPDATQSFTLTVAKASQAITFAALADRTIVSSPFGISATGGASTSAITFASTTTAVCTTSGLNGTTVTLVTTGTCSITASQAGDANYDPAPPVSRSFQVNAPPNFTLTVSKTGNGTVTSAPAGINCGSDCTEAYPSGTQVTLTATPDAGYALSQWGGACSGPFNCVVTMDAAKSVSATFVSLGSDLGTTITANPNPAVAGRDVTFTLTISSAGPEAGDGVTTWAFIPSGATFVSASAGCQQSTLGPNPIVLCFPNALAVGATAQYTFVLRRAAAGTLTVNADVSSSRQDPVAANNQSSVSVTVNTATRLGNISTRMRVGTGSDVLIGGFIIGGAASKRVAIVATGPSLTQYGIANALAHPTLSLVRQSDQAVIATNDGWQSAGNAAQLTAAGFAPSDALESAILIDLAPGAYTAIVQGAGGGSGVGIVAVYEVDHPEYPLVNISTRGQVLAGNDVMIGGFIVNGSTPQTVAIVATGPSLTQYGIANALANPTLTLVRQSDQAAIASNDDWQTDANAAQLTAAGFAPSNPLEAAIYITLQPGAYTAILSGAGGGTGVGIIGVYAVP